MDRRRSSLAYRAGPAPDVLRAGLAAIDVAVLMCFEFWVALSVGCCYG